MMKFPPGPSGHMVSFTTWQKFIRLSCGSDDMKAHIIGHVLRNVPRDESNFDLIDCFKLGYALGVLAKQFRGEALRDFDATIVLTRDMNNVPIVRTRAGPVS